MQAYEVPLSPVPQQFIISLLSVDYMLTLKWNKPAAIWVLDIGSIEGDPLIQGIPLVTGTNLLDQYEYVGIGGALSVQTDSDLDAVPTFDNLGLTGRLYFVVGP